MKKKIREYYWEGEKNKNENEAVWENHTLQIEIDFLHQQSN